jgi:hypothetical protein
MQVHMKKILSEPGVFSLAAGGLNLLFLVVFGWRTGPAVQAITMLWVPVAAIALGVAGLIWGRNARPAAVGGMICGLLPLAFAALIYWAFSNGNFNFVFK